MVNRPLKRGVRVPVAGPHAPGLDPFLLLFGIRGRERICSLFPAREALASTARRRACEEGREVYEREHAWLVSAMEEDFLHQGAPSRLDYLKTSLQVEREGGPRSGREEGREEGKGGGYDKKLNEKIRQLRGEVEILSSGSASSSPPPSVPPSSLLEEHENGRHAGGQGGGGRGRGEEKDGDGQRRGEAEGLAVNTVLRRGAWAGGKDKEEEGGEDEGGGEGSGGKTDKKRLRK
ncbi:hypothetical protein NGA_0486100 [Nannochloropsis gaditana CCMP526]|uniref:uncharacterized protein n=1 Tax=Nannochloropsis gaditana (strain CCMP526) TaxID=1093141 RepID=UPI00029F7167|nr:hypothetical protein NGA_0486100 [Nannochloropsis gaditana CCMP526]EKU22252.1 hypothetical protein NGA_0486100 [Nannochloropsis gaditana CCMP526]|eukprot:XP_005854109.1 hypothetical protein NGA_0486100 [Nannochloropsis gaditana CCMP526]